MAIIAVAFGTAFGALDEWHQRFTDRTPDVWDLVADVVGLACGAALVRLARQWRRKHGG